MVLKIEEPFLLAVRETLQDRYTENMDAIYRKTVKFIIETLIKGYEEGEREEREGVASVSNWHPSESQNHVSSEKDQGNGSRTPCPASYRSSVPEEERSGKKELKDAPPI
ncbi:unnamed protein product [Darwinula stevensoni]|uniref:Uncharacterized protein n=1 Tax=Darwinula stevensoni TaxID=69355 RepID=A0A7R8X6J6_9CRUS|nr:unnamed protein product [Darwinula stevensoni]CAG0887690.1 unnamed protein product [Darwinula stevensoni]